MTDDATLIRAFVDEGSETAFAQIVERHLSLVYSAAKRQLRGDSHLARDASQIVFTTLARKAASLKQHPLLTGWLYLTTRYAVTEIARAERRRRSYEQKALAIPEQLSGEDAPADWEKLRPMLDDVLLELNVRDREAILLRFFEGRAFADLGAKFAITEDAARMRVERALGKLQHALRRRGITSTVSALAAGLAEQPVVALPADLASAIAIGALGSAKGGAGGLVLWQFFTMGKSSTVFASVVLVTGASLAVLQQQTRAQLRNELSALRQDNREAFRLRQANERLTALAGRSPDPAQAAELARLRAEIDAMQALPAAGPGREFTLPNELRAMGNATPELAYESTLWAKKHRDRAALSRLITMDPAGRLKADALFGRLPSSYRSELGSTEAMVAAALTWDQPTRQTKGFPETDDEVALKTSGLIRFRAVDESSDDVTIQMLTAAGEPLGIARHYHQASDGWREVLPAGQLRIIVHTF